MNINAARSDDIKARMTCIGQKSPAILSAHIHLWYMCQPVQQNSFVRSKSYSAVYCHRSGLLLVYASFYTVAPGCFGVMRAFMSSFRAVLGYYTVVKWGFVFLIIFQVL